MKKREAPEQITLTRQEAEALKERVSTISTLSKQDITIITGLISF